MTLLATISALGGSAYDAFRAPEISAPVSSVADPFVVKFQLRNPSFLFWMKRLSVNCYVPLALYERGAVVSKIGIVGFSTNVDLEPGESASWECNLNRALSLPVPLKQAAIRLEGTFETLGLQRSFGSQQYNWDSVSKLFSEGKPMN